MKPLWPTLKEAIHCRSNIVLLLILGIPYFSPKPVLAQTYEETIDSLIILLDSSTDAKQRVDRLNEISYACRRVSLEKMIDYAQTARLLAEQANYQEGLAVALKNIGNGHLKSGSPPDTTNAYYQRAIKVAKKVGDHYTQAASLNNIGIVSNTQGSYNIGVQYLQQALVVFNENVSDPKRIALKCLILANLGNSYYGLKDYERAFNFQYQAIELAKAKEVRFIPAQYMDDLARSAASLRDFKQAEIYYNEALELQKEIGDYQSIVHAYLHFLEMKMVQADYAGAEAMGLEAVQIASSRGFPILVADGLNKLSEVARIRGKLDEAISYADSALQVSRNIFNIRHECTASYQLAQAFAEKQEYARAFQQLMQHHKLNDSIVQDEKKVITEEVQAQYQNRLFEQKVEILEAKQVAQRNSIQLLIGLIIMTIVLLAAITAYLVRRNQVSRIIENKNAVLEKYIAYNLQLENFAYIASHDLKSPLRNVVSFSQLLSRRIKDKVTDEERDYLNFIIAGTKEMSSLIDDLLNYSLVQREQLNVTDIPVKELIGRVVARNQPLIEEAGAQIETQVKDITIKGDAIKLNQLLQNLFTNALKFQQTGKVPKVSIIFEENESHYRFEIKDNGIGIDPQYFEKVFMVFKRLHTKKEYEGTGIGLAICKKIIEQHGGQIWVESAVGDGASFFFILPKQIEPSAN